MTIFPILLSVAQENLQHLLSLSLIRVERSLTPTQRLGITVVQFPKLRNELNHSPGLANNFIILNEFRSLCYIVLLDITWNIPKASWPLKAGLYDIKLMLDDGNTVLASTQIKIN